VLPSRAAACAVRPPLSCCADRPTIRVPASILCTSPAFNGVPPALDIAVVSKRGPECLTRSPRTNRMSYGLGATASVLGPTSYIGERLDQRCVSVMAPITLDWSKSQWRNA
jgi:hypothetical protein